MVCALLWLAGVSEIGAAPEGTLTIAMHFSPVTRWLDPAEGESTITPFLLLYVLHDGLLKPMPGVGSGPSRRGPARGRHHGHRDPGLLHVTLRGPQAPAR